MNFPILIAGIFSLLAALIHIFAGEKTNIAQLLKTDIQLSHKIELRGIWYALGIDLAITGFLLLFIGFMSSLSGYELLIVSISVRFILYGFAILSALLITEKRYLFKLPQWILLFFIGIFLWLGIYTS